MHRSASGRSKLLWILTGCAGVVVLAFFSVWQPPTGPQNSICLFRRATGIPCPGCGLTRAFAALAKGEWSAALDLHAFAYLFAAEVAVGWLVVGWWLWIRATRVRVPTWVAPLLLVQVAVYLAYWSGRLATGTLPW